MGNLELNPSEQKPVERKPIFLTPSNKKGQGLCRSLSPYIPNMNNSYINRSIINKKSMKNSYVSHLSYHNNRVYINPKMIKSVIKNTSVSSSLIKSNTSRIIKPRINTDESSMISLSKSPRNIRHSPIFKEKFMQKPFQSSPIRPRVTYRDLDQSLFYKQQKENLSLITQQQVTTPKGAFIQKVPNQSNKSSFNSSKKVIKFGNCTGKVLYNQGKTLNSCRHTCCCHRTCINNQYYQQASNQFDNFPTQRKKQIQKKQQKQEKQQTIQINNSSKRRKKYNYFQQSDDDSTINNKNILNSSMIHQQNRQKCQEIIKRVRNFNEFLNQVKKKIKKQTDSSINNTLDNISFTQLQSFNNASPNTSLDHNSISQQGQSQARSITLALKLQNQRIQLEKYRKLVERQLSKQHSIESIQIDSKNKQKIITINFEKKPKKQQNGKAIKQVEQSPTPNQQQQVQIPPLKLIKLNEPKQPKQKQKKEHKDTQQKNDISKRLNNINKLFNKMEGMNKIQTQTHRQILQIIKNQPDVEQYEEEQKQQSSK